jgi:integration host factor subunit beta
MKRTMKIKESIDINRLVEKLAKDGHCVFKGFGSFKVKPHESRTGRNPKTGESIEIAAGYRISFKPSEEFKKRIDNFTEVEGAEE